MFGLTMAQVYSIVDKKISGEVKRLKAQFGGLQRQLSAMKGRQTVLETRVDNIEPLLMKIQKMEEHLKIEFLNEKVVGYKKVRKTKK